MRIDGAHALVTGGSRGLGPTLARALAERGARVTLTARDRSSLASVALEIGASGAGVHAIAADVTDASARQRLLDEAEATLGPVDVLVNNAGVESIAPYPDLTLERIESMLRTNLEAPLLLSRLVLPGMRERGRGHVIMMASLGGKRGSPYSATYAATKAGLIAWTQGVRTELRGTGVSASVICPGFVSGAGMFADRHEPAPRLLGTSTPEAVAQALVRALEQDRGEVIVNPGPVRLLLVLDALCPGLSTWLLRRSGVYDYYRRQAGREST